MRTAAGVIVGALALSGLWLGCNAIIGLDAPQEEMCNWLADPSNCYRTFRIDTLATGNTCKPKGDPTAVGPSTGKFANGAHNGYFPHLDKLDICILGDEGGSIVFEPNLASLDLANLTKNVTITMTFNDTNGKNCGVATYAATSAFSWTINPPSGEALNAGSSSSIFDAGGDAAPPTEPWGTYSQQLSPSGDKLLVACPNGDTGEFDSRWVPAVLSNFSNGLPDLCPLFSDLTPRAELEFSPMVSGMPGAISFTIHWPPATSLYPSVEVISTGDTVPVRSEPTTYFNCMIPTLQVDCTNGLKDPGETDQDCGGAEVIPGCPARCGDGRACLVDCDCGPNLVCLSGSMKCGKPAASAARQCVDALLCENGLLDAFESDVDCGGPCPVGCADGDRCRIDSDCVSTFCFVGTCAPTHCADFRTNFGETDQDCGGPCDAQGRTCADGLSCLVAADCMSNVCKAGKCSPKDCTVACGVGCPGKPCTIEQPCVSNADCSTNACLNAQGGLTCVQPSCTDKVLDGDETDVDCGGIKCDTDVPAHLCVDGQLCQVDADCLNGVCGVARATTCPAEQIKKCFPASCKPDPGPVDAGFIDAGGGGAGGSSGADAGAQTCGGMCALCNLNDACTTNSDCVTRACLGGVCADPDCNCNDNAQDGNETDIDCGGGGQCSPCQAGRRCILNSDCAKDPAAPLGAGPLCFNKVCQ